MPTVKKIGEREYELDLKGYVCTYPQMYTSQALTKLPKGTVLKIIIDNPPSIENIKNVVQKMGAKLLSVDAVGGTWEIKVEK